MLLHLVEGHAGSRHQRLDLPPGLVPKVGSVWLPGLLPKDVGLHSDKVLRDLLGRQHHHPWTLLLAQLERFQPVKDLLGGPRGAGGLREPPSTRSSPVKVLELLLAVRNLPQVIQRVALVQEGLHLLDALLELPVRFHRASLRAPAVLPLDVSPDATEVRGKLGNGGLPPRRRRSCRRRLGLRRRGAAPVLRALSKRDRKVAALLPAVVPLVLDRVLQHKVETGVRLALRELDHHLLLPLAAKARRPLAREGTLESPLLVRLRPHRKLALPPLVRQVPPLLLGVPLHHPPVENQVPRVVRGHADHPLPLPTRGSGHRGRHPLPRGAGEFPPRHMPQALPRTKDHPHRVLIPAQA
mmetsp:Transcript_3811/g.10983  ORF Transcript_3811/g.10983 Transcript_3811/m.10983 type:complete len:354 (-) Transcript_3811:557-1618(-)